MSFFKSEFLKNIITLMTGTALAQVIPLAITPILTRIYSPEDFGLFALYFSIVSMISTIGAGKYEKAIILCEDDEEALDVMKICIFIVLGVSALTISLFLIFQDFIVSYLGAKEIQTWLYFIPITIFASAIYNILNLWFVRKKAYKNLSFNRVLKSFLTGTSNVGLGLGHMGSFGLVFSEAFSQSVATLIFGNKLWKSYGKSILRIKQSRFIELAKKYSNFPKYSLPADFINIFSAQLPVFLFNAFFPAAVVGHYSLAKRVLDAPVALLSGALLEVFSQKATEDYQATGSCRAIFIKTFKRLLLLSFIPFGLFFFGAPFIFSFFFGANWEGAGQIAQILSVMYFIKFIASPLSFTFYLAGKQKEDLLLHIYMLSSNFLILYCGCNFFDIKTTLIGFSINYFAIYLIYLFLSYKFSLPKYEF